MEVLARERTAEQVRQLIGFAVGAEEYGLDLSSVKEVIRARGITWLPRTPPFLKGIINLRGEVIPIVDVRCKFGLEEAVQTAETRIIVVELLGELVGLIVDSASQVIRLPADQIEPPPAILGEEYREYITGVCKMEDRLVVLMDVRKILTKEEVSIMRKVSRETERSTDGKNAEKA